MRDVKIKKVMKRKTNTKYLGANAKRVKNKELRKFL